MSKNDVQIKMYDEMCNQYQFREEKKQCCKFCETVAKGHWAAEKVVNTFDFVPDGRKGEPE
jgi:hypothetical protein